MRKKRNFFYLFVLNIVFTISIGFALLNKNLSMTGISKIDLAVWDLHFSNLYVVDGSVNSNTAPSISDDDFSVQFSVSLDKPGDFYEFTVDVINFGSIDAMIDSIVKTPELTESQKNI